MGAPPLHILLSERPCVLLPEAQREIPEDKRRLSSSKRERASCRQRPWRSSLPSALGPPSWSKCPAKHREVLNISLDPPRNEPDITQIKKIRQCVIAKKFLTS